MCPRSLCTVKECSDSRVRLDQTSIGFLDCHLIRCQARAWKACCCGLSIQDLMWEAVLTGAEQCPTYQSGLRPANVQPPVLQSNGRPLISSSSRQSDQERCTSGISSGAS